MTTRIRCSSLLYAALWCGVAVGQSLAGLRIGDDAGKLLKLGKPESTDTRKGMAVRKWLLAAGNELSVTTDANGQIVYIESDWGGKTDVDTKCDLTGLRFGTTTLAELRKRFGSNGFGFKELGGQLLAEDGAVMVNSYEAAGVVVTFYNKVKNAEANQLDPEGQGTIASHAKLDAISLASPAYAKSEWGDRVYDPAYKTVVWK